MIFYYFDTIFIFEEAEPRRARSGAGTSILGAYLSKKTRIFTPYTIPTSGIVRRDPPRHVDVIIQILAQIHVALFREKTLIPYIFYYFHYLQNSSGLGNVMP